MESARSSPPPRPLPWFRKVDYPDILSVMVDRHELPKEFEDWEYAATAETDRLTREGIAFFKVYLSPFSFLRWCKQNGQEADRAGREAFAAYIAAAVGEMKPSRVDNRKADATRSRQLSLTRI